MQNVINQTLNSLQIGEPVSYRSIVMFPLFCSEAISASKQHRYVTLDHALKDNHVTIEELSDSGSVPELLFKNLSQEDVLLVEGDHLVGAKQNRTLNSTILAAAQSELVIPVSCVEQGRWSFRSRNFDYSDDFQFAKGRRGKMSSVSSAMKRSRSGPVISRRSDQGEVWSAIHEKERIMESRSSTSAMGDMYQSHKSRISEYVEWFDYQPGQVGAVFIVADEISGFEYFETPEIMEKYLPRLVRSYSMEAISLKNDVVPETSLDIAASIVQDIISSTVDYYPSVGKGEDARLDSKNITGSGLLVDKRLVQLSAFDKRNSEKFFH